MSAKMPSTKAVWIDTGDATELTQTLFNEAGLYIGKKLKTRGHPKAATTKEPAKLRLDADVLAALRVSGEGWQTRINDTLRESLRLAGRV